MRPLLPEIAEKYHVGDEIEAIVVGTVMLTVSLLFSRKKIENIVSWRKIVAAYEAQEILEGKIGCKGRRSYRSRSRAYLSPHLIPAYRRDGDVSALVGTTSALRS